MTMSSSRRLISKDKLLYAGFLTVSLFVYSLFIILKIPASFSRFFSFYSVYFLCLLVALYFASFSLEGNWRWLALSCSTMTLFALALSYRWSSGYSDAAMIGGVLPYKDSYFYYNGARFMLIGRILPGYATQAAWRPLFPGFLSSVLLLTGQNLQLTLAILFGLVALCITLSGEKIYQACGRLAAIVYMTLLFLYAQHLIGYPLTETLGLALGCLGLILLWEASRLHKMRLLFIGLIVLVAAVSIRAGTFFVFPLLILWAGWQYRGEKRLSWRVAGIAAVVVLASFLLFNTIYSRLMVTTDASTFGNFAYTIYGQVMGGTGWTSGFVDTGSIDPAVIYQAAWDEFLQHPWSLAIAMVKSYRDFLWPTQRGIFSFLTPGGFTWLDVILWFAALILLFWSIVRAVREIKSPISSMLLFMMVGFFLSIPFLPPIDGGRRFYASTVPILFAFMASAFRGKHLGAEEAVRSADGFLRSLTTGFSLLVLILTAVIPAVTIRIASTPAIAASNCPAEQKTFALRVNPGSYIDISAEDDACGKAPQICKQDFIDNGTEKKIDDFFITLLRLVEDEETIVRVLPANDLTTGGFHYYVGEPNLLGGNTLPKIVVGCATEITTAYQSIYQVETVEKEWRPNEN